MGYKIDYYKFMKLQLAMENLMLRMLEDMAVLADVEKYMRGSNAIQCKSIDAVNSYVMNKHIETAIPAIESAISNFYKVENSYFFEMYNIDYKSGSIIEEEHLSEVEKELKRLKGEISTFIQNMNSDIKSVDHIVGLESPDVGDFEDGIDSLIKISEKLREDFETYEKSKLMEAKGIQWVVDASVATVEGCLGGIHNMVGYAPETDVELEVPEYTMRASAFYDVFQYTDERYQNVLDNKDEQTKLYYKYMESERLSQYFNNMLFATASMALPFGNKIRGTKLFIHEGISLISFAYSADRTYKGYELMQQVENMDADSEANGLFNLDNSEYGKYIKAIGEASNLYTAASASNLLEYKVFGKPVTISSNIATCGEEYISDKTNSLIYQVTGEQNLVTSVISGMVGNGFVNGVKLEIEDAGRLDIDPSVDYDVDFQNNSVIMDVKVEEVPTNGGGKGGKYSALGEMSDADGIRYKDWNYAKINELSIHNPDSDTLTLGKFRPSINDDGTENWKVAGHDSYNVIAENNKDMYFDMKDGLYDDVMENYNLSYQDMFDEFNTVALDKAIEEGKTVRFTHNPELAIYAGSFTEQEWKYLQEKGGYLYLREEGGFWYAEK